MDKKVRLWLGAGLLSGVCYEGDWIMGWLGLVLVVYVLYVPGGDTSYDTVIYRGVRIKRSTLHHLLLIYCPHGEWRYRIVSMF